MKTDTELLQDVIDELKCDPQLSPAGIRVCVNKGVVTLSGYIDSYNGKHLAKTAAERIKGVTLVVESLHVQVEADNQRTDAELAEAVLHALRWNANVPDEQINANVNDGQVRLSGQVNWHYQKDAAFNAVKNLIGIKDVINALTVGVRSGGRRYESEIRNAFHRNAQIDGYEITIAFKRKRMTLLGRVRSCNEKREVERIALSCPGVIGIDDYLIMC